jgi:small subunit ribosomal protein S4
MARYTGPRSKINRRFGQPLFGRTPALERSLERKNYPPGVHGSKGRRKVSDYAVALGEKQKLRYAYGILERQFRKYFDMARAKRGVTGEAMLQLLELRLDNVVYRLGFATSRRYARQMVTHGHIRVNGRKVAIPSCQLKPGSVISVRDHVKSRQMADRSLEAMQITPVPEWMALDRAAYSGTITRIPTRDDIQPPANEQLVVELYSR